MASVAPEIPVLARDEAFELLYRSYVKDVYHYALALLRNPADAEDVTQTTFLNAYRAYLRGDVIEKPQNWLIKIAHNVARTRYAHASRRVKEVPLEDHVDRLAVPEHERPNVEGVLRALGRLPFNQRAALVMRELEGRSYAEIADTIGVSVAAVETLIFRARRSLRLRASALRTLAAVPLPGSLAQLFESGGVVAGSGSFVGAGFLVKAALAILAGTVATGIGGGHTAPATAAQKPISHVTVAPASVGSEVAVRSRSVKGVQHAVAKLVRREHSIVAGAGRLGTPVVAGEQLRNGPRQPPASTPSGATATPTTAQVVAPVTNLADRVEQTVAAAVPTLPVQAPSLPPAPVQPPAVPKLP